MYAMTDQTDKIQWHPGFCSAAELELIENKTELEFIREYNIGKEPLRIDLLIIKKRPGAVIKNEIGSIFKQHNLLEYKSPDDGFSIDDYYKAIGYACIYKSFGETVDAIPAQEITVSFFREAYPRELIKSLMRELQKHSGFKILSKNAREEDVRRFLETVSGYTKQGDKNNADAVLQVSVMANKKLYQAIRRDFGMCEALKELMKDEIDKEADLRAEMIVQIKVQEAEKKYQAEIEKKVQETEKKVQLETEKTKQNTMQSDLNNLMENTGWTKEKAMKMLGISFSD
jgi:CRISPR/Cas system CSM-associated protein Csm2 small subunit